MLLWYHVLGDLTNNRRVYTAVYLSKGNTFQKLTGKNGHVDTLVGYNFQKEKSLPASFKPQEILWLRGYCTPDQFFDCLCIFLKNYNTLVTSKICFL